MPIIWKIEVSPNVHEITTLFDNIDSKVLKNSDFMASLWNDVYKKISEFLQKRFEEGKSNWRPLTPKYAKWKADAVRKGATVEVGQFGKRICKLTALGRLTDTMYPSATEKKFANIFEVTSEGGGVNNTFRYAISGNKLPYALYFDDEKARPFFYLTEQEADSVLDNLSDKIVKGITGVWNA